MLLTLPNELREEIVSYLPLSDLSHLMVTSHILYTTLQSETVWKALLARDYPSILCDNQSHIHKSQYKFITRCHKVASQLPERLSEADECACIKISSVKFQQLELRKEDSKICEFDSTSEDVCDPSFNSTVEIELSYNVLRDFFLLEVGFRTWELEKETVIKLLTILIRRRFIITNRYRINLLRYENNNVTISSNVGKLFECNFCLT